MIKHALAGGLSSLALVATAASAQVAPDQAVQPGEEPQIAESQSGIQEIIVTAQRKSEALSKVPISVTAYDADTIAEAHIRSLYDVASRTPNLQQTSQRKNSPNIFIRGIGSTEDAAGGDRSVGVFVDDVYIGRGSATTVGFFDIGTIEVLRGPQGTLYGRNVVGGALKLVTQVPKFELGYGAEATYGNYDLIEGNAYVNVPLSDIAAVRVAGMHSQHDGYALNVFTGNRVDAEKSTGGRVSFRLQPSDDFEIVLRAHAERTRDFGLPRAVSPCGPLICLPRFNQPGFGNIPLETDPRRVQNLHDGFFHRDNWGTSAKIDWTTGIGTFTSITGFLNNSIRLQAENGGVPDILRFKSLSTVRERAYQFTQELRLATPLTDRLDLTTGAYYYFENIDRSDNTDRCLSTNFRNSCIPASTNLDYRQNVDSRSLAGFAEVEFRPTDALTLTLGGRYTHDHKDANLAAINLGGPIPASGSRQPFGPFQLEKSWNAFTPRAVVKYSFDPLGMIYATISRGYKGGGFQGEAGNAASIQVPYDPEYVTNYEVGTKLQFFDRHVVLNAAGFIMKYNDLQVAQRFLLDPSDPTSIVNATNNAAKATIKGFEGDITVQPFKQLELWGSGAYLDARYDEFLDGTGGDFSGNRLPRVPKWAFTTGGRLTLPLGSLGELALRGDVKYKGKFSFTSANTTIVGADPFRAVTLVDGAATFTPANGPWEVSVWGKNLTNEVYRSTIIPVSDFVNSQFAPPRTYGVTLRFNH